MNSHCVVILETTLDGIPVFVGTEADCREWVSANIPDLESAEALTRKVEDNLSRDHADLICVSIMRVESGMCHQVEVLHADEEDE